MYYTATHNGAEYETWTASKKAPTHFVILGLASDDASNFARSMVETGSPFVAWRSSKKAAESVASRWVARFNPGTVVAHVVPCVPR